MYPTRELIRLSGHKAHLRRRLASHRNRISQDVSQVMRPFVLLKPVLAVWQAASPLVGLTLGVFVRRTFFPRMRRLRSFLRWSPIIAGMLRLVLVRIKIRYDASR